MAITTKGVLVPAIWSKALLDKFAGNLDKPSHLLRQVASRGKHFASIYERGFLEDIVWTKDEARLAIHIRFKFSGNRHIDFMVDDYELANSTIDSLANAILTSFPPDTLATECLRISAMPKNKHDHITRTLNERAYQRHNS